jgi:hypothetical protein
MRLGSQGGVTTSGVAAATARLAFRGKLCRYLGRLPQTESGTPTLQSAIMRVLSEVASYDHRP